MRNTYQTVIATDGNETFVLFLYEDVQWGNPYTTIGFNAGDGVRSFTPSLPDSVKNVETASNIGIPGTYIFRVDQESIMEPSVGM